jgi:hypothetical protein
MHKSIIAEINRSDRAFSSAVGRELCVRHGASRMLPVRALQADAEATAALDRKSGIDFLLERREGLISVAARVNFSRRLYASFTLRLRTGRDGLCELDKRLLAFLDPQQHLMKPALVVQATVAPGGGNVCLGAFAVDHDDLISAVIDPSNYNLWTLCYHPVDRTPFLSVWVKALRRLGVLVEDVVPPRTTPCHGIPGSHLVELRYPTTCRQVRALMPHIN